MTCRSPITKTIKRTGKYLLYSLIFQRVSEQLAAIREREPGQARPSIYSINARQFRDRGLIGLYDKVNDKKTNI